MENDKTKKTNTNNSVIPETEPVAVGKTESAEVPVQVETTPTGGTAIKTSPDTEIVAADVVTTENPPTPAEPAGSVDTKVVVQTQKKTSPWLVCALVFLVLALLCCGSLVALWFFAPNLILRSVSQNSEAPDTSVYTQGSSVEANKETSTLETKLNQAETDAALKNESSFTVNFTEKEIVSEFTRSLDDKTLADSFYLDINPERVSLRIDGKALIKVAGSDSSSPLAGLDPKIAEGLYVGVDLGVKEDGTLKVSKVTTGNAAIDSYIPVDAVDGIEKELNNAINNIQAEAGFSLDKVTLKDGSLDLTYTKK